MSSIEAIRQERLKKLHKLQDAGLDPYPARTHRTHTAQEFIENHAVLERADEVVTVAGRATSLREHGGSLFVDLQDGTGKAQAYLQKDSLGEEKYALFVDTIDAGDIIEVSGTAFTTKRGMQSLHATDWRILSKSLLPIPDEWFGLKDEDERYRKRYLDILLDVEVAGRIKRRSKFWNTIRQYLLARDFIEVETPVLETTTGGADARPFVTHHNALGIDVYLRISAGELWQKRLMVAGLPNVFEIGRIFRNEGMSFEHLQDYTQMEFYQAFSDYEAGMEMITDLYRTIVDEVYGTRVFTMKDFTVDLGAPWQRYDYCSLIKEHYGIDPLQTTSDEVAQVLKEKNIPFDPNGFSIERGVDLLWKQIRRTLGGPGFLIGVPAYLEPLAKRSPKDSRVVERFQVLIGGSENGKGFSELNDPIDQAERFSHQQSLRDSGDEEAQMNDASYVEALEYGMPPAFGFGISERFFSFLEGVSVREAQIFPLMKPKEETTEKKKPESKENKTAVAVIKKLDMEAWQVLNTVAHLSAELGVREGRSLLSQDSFSTADNVRIPLNIQHAIMLKQTTEGEALKVLFKNAVEKGLSVEVFTREMIETTSDKKIIEKAKVTNFSDIELLGVLIFGPQSAVEALTKEFPLYS